MPFTSAQISQMIGGQQVMFANQAALAHNIGAQAGFTPGGMVPLSQPNFGLAGYGGQDMGLPGLSNTSAGGFGAAAVGGMGGALPGLATGLSFAGGLGLLGSAGGYLDPFTGVGRAFMGGFGRAGGLSAFGAGGSAGIGAIGAGVASSLGPAALYYGAYKGISHVGEQLYAGAQNISQVGAMAGQYFGPQFGAPGARPGGQMARGQIQDINSILHEIAGEDTMTSMRDMKQLMDKAGQFGMLTGIQSASDFNTKFRRIVDQSKEIAKILGTTIEEGMGALTSFKQMGLWTPQDVMGGAMAMKMVGPQGRAALMQTMQTGASSSHAMGGSLAAGATLARNQFLNVQASVSSGLLSPEMLQEYTGGVGGVEGQQMLADRLTGLMQSMTQTPVGRLSMAGIGEFKNGKFTGRVDQEMMRKLQAGELSVGQLQSMGQRNAGTREGAASFTWRQDQIGQEMMAQGGLELVGGMYQAGLSRAGFGNASDEIQGIMLQKLYGMQRRDAQMMQKIIKDLPRMAEERSRKELGALQDAMRQLDERRNRSWEGLKDVIKHSYEETMERPFQELAASMSTSINERVDRVSDYMLGRTRQINMSDREKLRTIYSIGQTPDSLPRNIDMFMQSGAQSYGGTTAIERMRRVGGFRGLGAAAAGSEWRGSIGMALGTLLGPGAQAAFGGFAQGETGYGTKAQEFVMSGARTTTDINGPGNVLVSNVGAGSAITSDEVMRTAESIRRRAGVPSAGKLFDLPLHAGDYDLSKVRAAYQGMLTNTDNLKKLRDMKERMSPAEYAKALTEMLRKHGGPGVQKALDDLRKSNKGGGTGLSSDLDVLAVLQGEDNWKSSFLQADFAKVSSDTGAGLQGTFLDGEAFSNAIDADVDKIMALAGGMTQQQAVDMFGAGTKGVSRLAGETSRDAGFSKEQLRTFLTEGGQASRELGQFLADGGKSLSPEKYPALFNEAHKNGNKKLLTFLERVSELNPTQLQFMRDLVGSGGVGGKMEGKAVSSYLSSVGDLATSELGALKGGGTAEERAILGRLVEAGGTHDFDIFRDTEKRAAYYGRGLSKGDAASLRKRGGAFAEHLVDFYDIEHLNLTGKTGRSLPKGLQDDLAAGLTANPEEFAKIKEILDSGKGISKDQNERIRKAFAELEERLGMGGGKLAGENQQAKLTENLTNFVGASRDFVIAVSGAVPALGKLTAEQYLEAARKVSEGGATGGPNSGRQ